MNKLINRKRNEGFTIIEVVLVLAIAGLIFLIVFTALPQLQRSRRDTQRKSDLGRMTAAVISYQSSRFDATIPPTADFLIELADANGDGTVDGGDGSYLPDSEFTDPSGTPYRSVAAGNPGFITYVAGTDCSGATGSIDIYSITMTLEQGDACQDNR